VLGSIGVRGRMAAAAVLLMFAAYAEQGCQYCLVVSPMVTLMQRCRSVSAASCLECVVLHSLQL
jgi:hypothetical protein